MWFKWSTLKAVLFSISPGQVSRVSAQCWLIWLKCMFPCTLACVLGHQQPVSVQGTWEKSCQLLWVLVGPWIVLCPAESRTTTEVGFEGVNQYFRAVESCCSFAEGWLFWVSGWQWDQATVVQILWWEAVNTTVCCPGRCKTLCALMKEAVWRHGCVTVEKTGIIARRPDNVEKILFHLLHTHGGCPPWGFQS